ncbi:hypothetical protein CEXT_110481 [Caerostris extrusa]|uniref:Uncharacterized protein n=1 Tax=Caerostris extrusa TaxID=172846 RepID=A0AAV4SVU7_CAEEX|nr:hypothetical protein CEXT_110481 [Caerostris extrusa]
MADKEKIKSYQGMLKAPDNRVSGARQKAITLRPIASPRPAKRNKQQHLPYRKAIALLSPFNNGSDRQTMGVWTPHKSDRPSNPRYLKRQRSGGSSERTM